MRYTGCMGWLRNLIFGEPNDEYLARISSIKNIGDGSRAGLPQEINGGVENKPDETPVANEFLKFFLLIFPVADRKSVV